MITLEDYLTSSGKYPDRQTSKDCTDEVKANAAILLDKVNKFLSDIGQNGPFTISSGFRTAVSNAATPNAAKSSGHMKGLAIDIHDNDHELSDEIKDNADLLRTYGLFLENPNATASWAHLDMVHRPDRPNRIFNP